MLNDAAGMGVLVVALVTCPPVSVAPSDHGFVPERPTSAAVTSHVESSAVALVTELIVMGATVATERVPSVPVSVAVTVLLPEQTSGRAQAAYAGELPPTLKPATATADETTAMMSLRRMNSPTRSEERRVGKEC